MTAGYEVISDGVTVWVNKGWLLGRFGRYGIDIHRDINEQSTKGECLHCTHTETGPAEWEDFVVKMKELHGIVVAEKYRPKRCRRPA